MRAKLLMPRFAEGQDPAGVGFSATREVSRTETPDDPTYPTQPGPQPGAPQPHPGPVRPQPVPPQPQPPLPGPQR